MAPANITPLSMGRGPAPSATGSQGEPLRGRGPPPYGGGAPSGYPSVLPQPQQAGFPSRCGMLWW